MGSRILPVHLCRFRRISTSGLGVGVSRAWFIAVFGRRSQVTVHHVLRGYSPVCIVGVLWPKGWIDQDATWYGGIGSAQATLCQMGMAGDGKVCVKFFKACGRPCPITRQLPIFCGFQLKIRDYYRKRIAGLGIKTGMCAETNN